MKKKTKIIIISIITVLFLVIAFFVAIGLINHNNKNIQEHIEVNAIEQLSPLTTSDSSQAAELIKTNIVKVVNKIDDDTSIIGTGFFDKSGYLVTNSHLVDIQGTITIEYSDGKKSNAQIFSNDILSDIALLAVENPKVKSMYYGETLSLKVTDDVYAIGYPYALTGEASVSKGVLSARRSAGTIGFLQSDISLNIGNSGGPLINDKAEVLGINTYATENASIGMSISSESLQEIIKDLIENPIVNYLENERPSNALSVVLNEIGYEVNDLYNEDEIIKKSNDDKIYNDEGNGKNHTNNGNNNNKQDKEKTKSSNALLASLTIDNYKIDFSSSITDYYITLKNDEKSLAIDATTQDSLATFTISNNNNFTDGQNKIVITVKAEDGTIKEYKINVTKPLRYLEGAAGILCCLDTQKYNGVNSLVVSGCDFVDSDGIRLYANTTLDVVESVKLDVYAGWNNNNVTGANTSGASLNDIGLRFLKSYTFAPAHSYGIPLSELRTYLTEDDYQGGLYQGADLTVYITMKTRKQGSFTEIKPWGLSK